MWGCHGRFIVPTAVLRRLADDDSIPTESRQALLDSAAVESAWRELRRAHSEATQSALLARGIASLRLAGVLAPVPAVTVYDCKNTQSLPGSPVANPDGSSDMTAKRAFDTTHAVIDFYRECFGRNSVDDAGMTLISSIHYGVRYDNAFWNGSQMTYGDGDGRVFTDFTKSDDVIGHELTHGVTQFKRTGWSALVSSAPSRCKRDTRACAIWPHLVRSTAYRRNRRTTATTSPKAIRMKTAASRITRSTSRRRPSVDKPG